MCVRILYIYANKKKRKSAFIVCLHNLIKSKQTLLPGYYYYSQLPAEEPAEMASSVARVQGLHHMASGFYFLVAGEKHCIREIKHFRIFAFQSM